VARIPKKGNILNNDFIIIPINSVYHWILIIIVNPDKKNMKLLYFNSIYDAEDRKGDKLSNFTATLCK
jgi:Ulp1 family protease